MSSYGGKPGKTAPRLIQDLYYYDPRKAGNGNRNVLCDAPPPLDKNGHHEELAVPNTSCHHEYMIKYDQSLLFSAGSEGRGTYKVASLCNKCRWHMDIYIDLGNGAAASQPCPGSNRPLHHLVFDRTVGAENGSYDQGHESRFICAAQACGSQVRVRLQPPRLSIDDLRRLAYAEALKARNIAARAAEPDRDHIPLRTIEVMDILSKYVRDSLIPAPEPRRVNARNRKFMNAFGKDCNDILEYLGFTNQIIDEGEGSEEYWYLPQPPASDGSLDGDPHRRLLEDVQLELLTLISHRPDEQKRTLKNFVYGPMPSVIEIEKLLGCLEYERSPASRRAGSGSVATSDMEHPAYAVLGALGNFSDSLILWAYKQQKLSDPMNSALYYECFRMIANERDSDFLNGELAILTSLGQVDREEMNLAYKYFSIEPSHHLIITDQVILGRFEPRLQSSGDWQADEIRHRLTQLGAARGSELLRQVAARTIETYDQAMSWLGADKDTPDDYMITLYNMKMQDNMQDPSHRESCQRALEIIAESRKSEMLKTYLRVGDVDADTVVEDAYRLLGINDRSSALDPQVLRGLVDSWIMDQPEKAAQFEQAYEVLLNRAPMNDGSAQADPAGESIQYAPEEWPVGLANIGNTCYLNSLLQFYFSIKPIREMILDIDNYKMEITEDGLKAKRVGGRLVDKEEVERAQEFTHELHKLFAGMVSAKGHVVRPEIKLAALTLPEVRKQENATNSGSNTQASGTGLGQINGAPVAGPMLPPSIKISTEEEIVELPPAADSPASDSTLVGEFTPDSDSQDMEGVVQEIQTTKPAEEDDQDASGSASNPVDLTKEQPLNFPEPPKKPPPVPPRPPKDASDLSREIANLEFRAEQKDVTDAMDNVLDQIERAISGNGVDKSGEQIDIIKQLFYYSYFRTVWKIDNAQKRTETALEKDWNIKVPMADYPRDLYACLDDVFDRESYQLNNENYRRYATMTTPPPILQILFQRVQFKRQQGQSVKNNQHVKFDEVIYMDRYLHAPDTDLLTAREHSWNMKRRLRTLEEKKASLTGIINEMDAANATEAAANFLTGHKYVQDEEIVALLHEKARVLRDELAAIENNIAQLKKSHGEIFEDLKQVKYQLYSVIFQRGGASGGHYWCFIKDFKFDIWRKYNDRVVSFVEDTSEIFDQKPNDLTATPYFLVYVRAGLEDELTDAVYRRIEPEEEPVASVERHDTPEVEMKEVEKSEG